LDNRFTPFGAIDVRLDAQDVCPEILDVCCRITNAAQQPVTPPPIVNKTGVTGCGVRNVGGLDFTLVGDFVSNFLDFFFGQTLTDITNHLYRTTKLVLVSFRGQLP
jgi:hypothetical protein